MSPTAVHYVPIVTTILAVFYIPLFFVIVRRTTRDGFKRLFRKRSGAADPETAA